MTTVADNTNVGLIGIGLLGTAIAERLLAGQRRVFGFDIDSNRQAALQALGGTVAAADEVFADCPVLIFCLPHSGIVAELVDDSRSSFRRGQTVIDTTTGDPGQMIRIGQTLAELGAGYVEANVAGSSDQMRRGEATLFVGGEAEPIAAADPILASLSSRRFVLGPVGAASRMKLVHNLVLGLHRAVLAEGLVFAESVGFDASDVLHILQQSPAASEVMKTKGQRMIERQFEPQARLAQHLKDVALVLAEAERSGQSVPLSKLHRELLEAAVAAGYGNADNSAIIEVFRNSNV